MPALPAAVTPRRRVPIVLAAVATLSVIALAVAAAVPSARAQAVSVARVDLGSAAGYSALASTAVTNDGASVYPQNVGVAPGATLTGMEKAKSHGELHSNDDAAKQAHADLVKAYNATALMTKTGDIADDLGGRTILPGVYHAVAALAMTTTLTFDAMNDPNAVFIFQLDAALNTTAGSTMVLKNGANAANIFWQVTAAVTLGGTSTFMGTIIGNAAVTIGSGSFVTGRALTINGPTTITNTIFTAVADPVTDPVADSASTGQGIPVTVNVLVNDSVPTSGVQFSRAALSTTPQLIGAAAGPIPAAPTVGAVTCTPAGDCTYQSPASFVGTDGFDYALSHSAKTWNVHVTITVTALPQTPVLRNDKLVATIGGPAVHFSPLANDSNSVRDTAVADLSITGVTAVPAGQGTLSCDATDCVYQPPSAGFIGTATATYTARSRAGSASSPNPTATITIFVDPAAIQMNGFTDTQNTAATVPVGTWTSTASTPTIVAACSSGRPTATVSWTAVAGTITWVVERRYVASVSAPSTAPWVEVASIPAASLSFTDALLGEGNNYQWQVRPDLHRWAGVFSPSGSAVTSAAMSAAGC